VRACRADLTPFDTHALLQHMLTQHKSQTKLLRNVVLRKHEAKGVRKQLVQLSCIGGCFLLSSAVLCDLACHLQALCAAATSAATRYAVLMGFTNDRCCCSVLHLQRSTMPEMQLGGGYCSRRCKLLEMLQGYSNLLPAVCKRQLAIVGPNLYEYIVHVCNAGHSWCC
jgi:hypothetical protein